MTKSKSPATRGIVARLEEALGPLRASVTESVDGVARRLLREAKNLRTERDELIEKRHVEIESVERLKAETASLLESLRAVREAKREAENEMVAAESQLEWLSDAITGARPIDDFGLSLGVVREAVDLRTRAAAAEQRAEAAEKEHRLCTGKLIQAAGRIANAEQDLAAAEKRAADLMGALRGLLDCAGFDWHGGAEVDASVEQAVNAARAALHDEERSDG